MEKFAVEFSWVLTDTIRTSTFIMENNAATCLCRFCFRLKKFEFSYILKLILSIPFFLGGGGGGGGRGTALIREWKKMYINKLVSPLMSLGAPLLFVY